MEPTNQTNQPDAKPKPQGAPRPQRGGGGRSGGRGRRPQPIRLPQENAIPVNKSSFNGTGGEQATQIKPRKANEVKMFKNKLRVIPLGGLGEIGKNMNAFEYGNDIIVVDMGSIFPNDQQPGIDHVIPDTTYLEKNKHKIRGHIITHAHLDHIGGVGYILPKIPAPMYGARFTLAMIEKALPEHNLNFTPQFRVMDPSKHERVQLGEFNVELVRMNHSIPDACAVMIRTPAGSVLVTGDWRVEDNPLLGQTLDWDRLKQIGEEGLDLLMADSTNATVVGRNASERDIIPSLTDLFNRANGRIIVSTFASSINRVQMIIDAAKASNRKLALTGRSMLGNIELAVKLGYIKVPPGLIMRVQDTGGPAGERVVILCTGSQGEENSALSRMSTGDHPHVKMKPGDTVILSSNPIGGNIVAVQKSVSNLMREGVKVYQNGTRALDNHGIIHVSGHATRDEQIELIETLKPRHFMPIHGEFYMLVTHAETAVQHGVDPQKVFVLDNGDTLEVVEGSIAKGERVQSGILLVDGSGIGDVENLVLRDRLAMGGDGVLMVVATVDRKSGRLLTSPDIISRGFVHMKESEELISKVRQEVRRSFERRNPDQPADWAKFKLRLRDDISDLLYARTKRNPMVLPVINEVGGGSGGRSGGDRGGRPRPERSDRGPRREGGGSAGDATMVL